MSDESRPKKYVTLRERELDARMQAEVMSVGSSLLFGQVGSYLIKLLLRRPMSLPWSYLLGPTLSVARDRDRV